MTITSIFVNNERYAMAKEKYTTFTPRKLQTNFTMGLSQNYIKVQISLFTHMIYYLLIERQQC